jgi:hypothetical protein
MELSPLIRLGPRTREMLEIAKNMLNRLSGQSISGLCSIIHFFFTFELKDGLLVIFCG